MCNITRKRSQNPNARPKSWSREQVNGSRTQSKPSQAEKGYKPHMGRTQIYGERCQGANVTSKTYSEKLYGEVCAVFTGIGGCVPIQTKTLITATKSGQVLRLWVM